MIRDLRFAFRTLRKHRGTSFLAILVLALGLAANTVVFSLVYGLILEPLDFPQPDRLMRIFGTEDLQKRGRQRVSEAAFVEVKRRSTVFAEVVAARNMGLSITDAERPLNPLMREVSSGHFELLGAEPVLGRLFSPDEHRQRARVVVLHYGLWQSHFGGDPKIVGRTIELAYEPYEIIGVMAPTYRNPTFPQAPVLWLPFPENATPGPGQQSNIMLLGRLRPGAVPEQAQDEVAQIAAELAKTNPETHAGRGLRLVPVHQSLVEPLRPAVLILAVAVGFVLLIACGNVANLLLAQALGRQREIGVRLALGAGRLHLVRQLLAESLILSLLSCALGLLIAFWSLEPLAQLAPSNINVPLLERVELEPQVVWFSLGLALLTSILFGLVPMAQLAGSSHRVLAAGASRSVGDLGRRRLRDMLVVAEITLSMVLLVGAGLMVRSFAHLRGLDLGFVSDALLAGRTGARGPGLDRPEVYADFHRRVLDELAALPGVKAVGECEFLPMFAGGFGTTTAVSPAGENQDDTRRPGAVVMSATPGYFAAFGQPILAGRDFSWDDRAEAPQVGVISRNLARRLWGDDDPLGKQLFLDGNPQGVEIVGVAGDLRGLANTPEAPPILFRPLAQRPVPIMTFLVRATGDPQALIPPIEGAIWAISRDVPVYGFTVVEQLVHDLEWQPRFVMQLLTGFAFLALLLAASGIYAVLSCAVTERTREIGVRVAVGARSGDILRLVEGDVLRLAALGVGLGLAASLGLSKLLASQLLGVTATDPLTYVLIAGLLLTTAVVASAVPALRAIRVDPVIALRGEG